MRNSIFIALITIMALGLFWGSCNESLDEGEDPYFCKGTLVIPTIEEDSTRGLKEVPYNCNEIILDPANPKVDGWRKFLSAQGFVPKDSCSCGSPLELWFYPNEEGEADFNVIGIVEDPPPDVDAITGDDPIGASLNFVFAIDPVDLDTNAMPVQPEQLTNPCPQNPVKVAVTDSGVDIEGGPNNTIMADFGWSLALAGENCPDPQTLGFNITDKGTEPEDLHGHGTSVNGVVAGMPYHNDVMLELPLEFLNIKITEGNTGAGNLFDALCGMYHAIGEGARVINISWGYLGNAENEEIPMLSRCLDSAAVKDIIVVAGMGNNGEDLNGFSKFLPASLAASHPNVISVGALQEVGTNRAGFSNWSANPDEMTITAPGVNVITAYPTKLQGTPTGVVRQTGTSMAAPFVTRTVAAIWSIDPNLSPQQVITIIKAAANDTEPYLILDHKAAVQQVCPDFQ